MLENGLKLPKPFSPITSSSDRIETIPPAPNGRSSVVVKWYETRLAALQYLRHLKPFAPNGARNGGGHRSQWSELATKFRHTQNEFLPQRLSFMHCDSCAIRHIRNVYLRAYSDPSPCGQVYCRGTSLLSGRTPKQDPRVGLSCCVWFWWLRM